MDACVRTVPENDFRGKIEPPVEKGALKIERFAQRLTQGYSAYRGSYLWAPADVKNVLHVDEMTIETNSNQKQRTEFGQDSLNTIFNISIYLCNDFLAFRVRRRNVTQMYGELEKLRKDFNLAGFRVTDWCRLKPRFTNSL